MTRDAKIKALAPWFGSKRTLAADIVAELGPHSAYWEPFCGSMSVLLNKTPVGHEHVNDMHGDLINLARVIQDETLGPALYRQLRRVTLYEGILGESWEALANCRDDPEPSLRRAFLYFVASWSGRNGFAGTTNVVNTNGIAVRWTPTGGHGGQRFASAVDSIPHWRRRLRGVVILRRDAFDVIANIDDHPRVAVYVDPPYLKKDATYQHDFTIEDHRRLSQLLSRFRAARVVVSYYAHPLLDELYQGWTLVDRTITKGLHNAGKRGQKGKAAPEVLLINGPSYAEPTTQGKGLFA